MHLEQPERPCHGWIHTDGPRWYSVSMTNKPRQRPGPKADFVRANPTVTARELVELGKKQGILLTASHIYNIRGKDKNKRAPMPLNYASPASSISLARDPSLLDAQLRTLVIRIGLDRAERLLDELKSALTRLA